MELTPTALGFLALRVLVLVAVVGLIGREWLRRRRERRALIEEHDPSSDEDS